MECNKDEAIRAKEIAEKKMLDKDFSGARRIALKAQRLYPDCDDISLMLSVCDVHCSAEQRMLGNEMDWYGILQIDQSANEASIKKQFRKLALLLHPDKNKFPGAEAAFKLTGEAQRLLLDQGRRSLYDMKYKASGRHVTPTQQTQNASESSNVGNNCSKKFTGLNPPHQQPQQQNQTVDPNGLQTFWTVCSSCTLKHEYYRVFVNKILRCQSCSKPFVAYDINFQGASPETNCSEPGKVESRNGYNHTSNGALNGNLEGENSKTAFFPEKRCCSEVSMGLGTDRKSGNVNVKNRGGSDEVKPSLGEHYKRRRKRESNESCDSGSCRDSKIEFECLEDQSPRKSRQKKHNASVNENLGGEECLGKSSKRAERSGLSCSPEEGNEDASLVGVVSEKNHIDGSAATTEEDVKDLGKKGSGSFKERLPDGNVDVEKTGKQKVKGDYIAKCSESFYDSASNEKPEGAADLEFHTFPDSDFSNFDKEGDCFRVGQIWACYDTLDAMPRFYARIRAVYSPGFKLKITWLTPEPDNEDEITWVNEDLPVSCGKFVPDKTEVTEDYLMFSHLNYWEKGSTRGSYKIYPRIGETWALFKNWDIEWKSDTNNKRTFEFEFVEILSEYVEGLGISVAHLGKIKGFSCLFCRTVNGGGDSFRVPPNQLYRFSHRVPSFKMTGEEREDVPRGSFELDPASLPTHLEEIPIPENIEEGNGKTHTNGFCSKISSNDDKPLMGSVASTSMYRVQKEGNVSSKGSSDNVTKNPNSTQAPNPETYQIPDPEFYDFDADKPIEKFQIGQVWALYGDEDGLPKYYGQIKHIYRDPHFRMHLTWFLPCPLPEEMVQWHDREVPVCCGRFKLKRGKPQIYESIGPFSHQLRAEVTNKKGEYIILPRKGEIWALYIQWNADMKRTGLYNCEYDIVEILTATKAYIDQFSRCLYVEYKKSGIDVQCQVPLYVATRMASIKRSSFFVPSTDGYARAALRSIGYEPRCTPYWPHSLLWALASMLPESAVDAWRLGFCLNIRKRGQLKESGKKE